MYKTPKRGPGRAPKNSIKAQNAFSEGLMETYNDVFAKREVSDVPTLGPAFCLSDEFLPNIIFALVAGAFTGSITVVFNIAIRWMNDQILGEDYGDEGHIDTLGWGGGQWWWIFMGLFAGMVVGFTRYLFTYVEPPTGFFQSILTRNVHPQEGVLVFFIGWFSLCMGCSLGPSGPMGALGGAFGIVCANLMNKDDEQATTWCLIGMAGALGSLFGAPYLSPLMLSELSYTRLDMELIVVCSIAACVSYMVYVSADDGTYIEKDPVTIPIQGGSEELNIAGHNFTDPTSATRMLLGLVYGLTGGLLGLLFIMVSGVFKKVAERNRARFDYAYVFLPMLGGLLYGLIGFICPLTMTDGKTQTALVIQYGEELGSGLLIGTMIFKIFTHAICANFGFIGGLFFPIFFIGTCYGVLIKTWFSDADLLLAISCTMVGVPAGFCPMPFTLICIVQGAIILSSDDCAPLLFAFVGGHFWTGIGILQKLRGTSSAESERQTYIKESIRLIQHSVTNNARSTLRNNRKTNLRFSVKGWGAQQQGGGNMPQSSQPKKRKKLKKKEVKKLPPPAAPPSVPPPPPGGVADAFTPQTFRT